MGNGCVSIEVNMSVVRAGFGSVGLEMGWETEPHDLVVEPVVTASLCKVSCIFPWNTNVASVLQGGKFLVKFCFPLIRHSELLSLCRLTMRWSAREKLGKVVAVRCIKLVHSVWGNSSLNPDNATSIHSWEPRRRNWPCSLGRRDSILFSTMSVTIKLANHNPNLKRENVVLLSLCVSFCDAA